MKLVPSGKSARRRLTALALLAAVAVSACADDKPLNTFEPAGPKAEEIDNLMAPIWVVMGVIFVLIIGGAIVIAWRNRVSEEDFDYEDLPAQIHGNTRVEILWTLIPAVVLAAIAVPVAIKIWDLEEKNEPDELDVMVIGQQWWWEYRYDIDGDGFFVDANGDGTVDDLDRDLPLELSLDPDDVVTANDLVIPAGEQVDLTLTSRDVIHSFWIPRLNGKRDTVPGRWHTWSLEASDPGKYTGWCTEFCGMSHARMRMAVIALPEAEFDAWLANQAQPAEVPTDEAALRGRDLFQANCMSCHVIDDGELEYPENFEAALVSKAAPNLTHFATRIDYAGAIYSQYLGPGTDANDDAFDVADYLSISQLATNPDSADDYRWNTAELKRWVANASERKDMAPDEGRGMLPFPQLSDADLDDVVAYLATLD
jgi:cytochrome c oxidase subunit 2